MYKEINFDIIDSTNTYLKNHYQELDNFTFVQANYQSQGKGRNDRIWLSNKGENLMFSLLICKENLISYGGFLSLVAAVSIAKIIESYHLPVSIKWPNDIYVGDKKVCGILLEGKLPEYIIIGCGINVNQKEFQGEYRLPPTSIAIEVGKDIDIEVFKKQVFETMINELTNINRESLISYFNDHNYLKDKKISVMDIPNCSFDSVDDNFNLIVIDDNHHKHVISSGEVSIKIK